MARNVRLLASHPMDNPGRAIGAGQRNTVIVALIAPVALFGAGALYDHHDSGRRMANVQAALDGRGPRAGACRARLEARLPVPARL